MNKFNFLQTAAYTILKKQLDETGGEFTGTMDDIADGATYVKTENNFTDDEKTKLSGLTGGLTSAQALAIGLL